MVNQFLDIRIERDSGKQEMRLSQASYIDKILRRFNFNDLNPQRTPMVTSQVANKERKQREENLNNENKNSTLTKQNAPYREA